MALAQKIEDTGHDSEEEEEEGMAALLDDSGGDDPEAEKSLFADEDEEDDEPNEYEDYYNSEPRAKKSPVVKKNDRSCLTCIEDKPFEEYYRNITYACTRSREICEDCAVSWVKAKVEDGLWNSINCPQCPNILSYAEVSHILGPQLESFQRQVKTFLLFPCHC